MPADAQFSTLAALPCQIFVCATTAVFTVEFLTSSFEGFEYQGQFGMIQENSAILFDINRVVPVSIYMFIPVAILGAIGGLFGALFNTIVLQTTAFRGKYIKPYRNLFLLEPVAIALVYMSAMIIIPVSFMCVRADCDGDSSSPGCERVGLSNVDDTVAYGCPAGSYNQAASLFVPSGEHMVKQLFARGFHYQFDYLPLIAMLAVYLPVSAYANGIACSTGIVIPCLMNGALIGRIFGLLMTDLLGVHNGNPDMAWVDPGAFALIGAAGFFAGVARITMALTVIMTEISNDTHFILPIMTAIMMGKWVGDATGSHPIYHALMAKKNLPYLPTIPHTHMPLACFSAGQVACAKVVCVPLKVSVPQLARLLLDHKHNAFPVTVEGPSGDGMAGQFVGLVLREHLVALAKSPNLWIEEAGAQGTVAIDLPAAAGLPPAEVGRAKAIFATSIKGHSAFSQAIDVETFKRVIVDLITASNAEAVAKGRKPSELPSATDLEAAFVFADADGSGGVDEEEFIELYAQVLAGKVKGLNLSTDFLSEMELKAFDYPEELSSAALDLELSALTTQAKARFSVDLRFYVDTSAVSVCEAFALDHAFNLFRSMGLRHMVVVDAFNTVTGIITRHNLMEANLNATCTHENMKSPEELLTHFIGDTVAS